jgi:hypothetical protein
MINCHKFPGRAFTRSTFWFCVCTLNWLRPMAQADEVVTVTTVEKIPGLMEVPATLAADQRDEFYRQKEQLHSQRAALQSAYDHYNSEAQQDAGELAGLEAMRRGYISAAKAYNQALGNEIAAEAGHPPPLAEPGPTAADLAQDTELAGIAGARLDLINARITRLQKGIAILSDANPEWHHEWQELQAEQAGATHQLMWASLDLATFGFAQGCEKLTEAQLEQAREAFRGQEFEDLMQWQDTLKQVQARLGFSLPAWDREIAALGRLKTAAANHDLAAAFEQLHAVAFGGREACEAAREAKLSPEAMTKLYQSSLAMGRLAIAFSGGLAGQVAAPVDATFKSVEVVLTVKLIREENQQFSALSDQAYARDTKKLELMKTQAELEVQATSLKYVIQRSHGLH